MPDDEFGVLREALTKACPAPSLQMLTDWLGHANEPSFKARIEELVAKAASVAEPLTATFANYPGKLRDYRIQYAHWLGGKPMEQDAVAEVADLYDATRIILEACLMQDLGWSASEAEAALAATQDFARLLRRPRVPQP